MKDVEADFVRDFFNTFALKIAKIQDEIVQELAEIGQEAAETTNLFKDYGSANGLRQNIKIIPAGTGIRDVLADKDYAYWVEEGNNQKGEWITPQFKRALKFKVNGDITIFRKKVRSHGPLPFMRNARDTTEKMVPQIVEKHILEFGKKYGL